MNPFEKTAALKEKSPAVKVSFFRCCDRDLFAMITPCSTYLPVEKLQFVAAIRLLQLLSPGKKNIFTNKSFLFIMTGVTGDVKLNFNKDNILEAADGI